MHSRFAARKTLAPALTANWLIIMAGIAGMAIAPARAADEDDRGSIGDAADSPIVDDEGSADQFLTGLFLTYRFR